MRLRTLPLSTAGIALGLMLACQGHDVPWYVILLTVMTTVSLQILSNLSNELGDWLSGVDSDDRNGPQYSMQEGGLTEDEMRSCIRITVLVCMILGLERGGYATMMPDANMLIEESSNHFGTMADGSESLRILSLYLI